MTDRLLLIATLSLLLTACEPPEPECGLLPVYETNSGGRLYLDQCTGRMSVGDADDPERWLPAAGAGHPTLGWADDDIVTTMRQGRFVFEGVFDVWRSLDGAADLSQPGILFTGSDDTPASLLYGPGPQDSIHLRLEVGGAPDRTSIAFGCTEGERFYGTGARPQGTDHTASSPLLYAAEQGIGQRDYDLDEFDVLNGRTGDSYFPVPWTVTDRGVGVAIGGTPMSRMYLCDPFNERDTARFEVWGETLDLFIFPSGSPRQAVSDWTLASGPPVAAPDWAYGPWIAVQRGTDALLAVADQLRDEGIPATALWAQDWIGGRPNTLGGGYDLHYHWEWDEEQYPGLPDAIDSLHDDGFAFLGYFNPFITEDFVEWTEAQDNGYLPLTPDGEPYEFAIVDRYGSQVDLSNEEAWAWAKEYLAAAPEMGQDGWMCDFAEWLPLDATVGPGLSGLDLHNAYPLQWQTLNMEVLNEAWGEGNALCFNRSGWAGTQAIAPVTWGGDQETTFARDDGMPTAREIGVGLGLSGIGRYGSDIAGFSSVVGGPSTQEVYLRWVEMAAFEPVMRTHDGLAEEANHHWAVDDVTLEHFRRYARLHMQLLPYLRWLDVAYRTEGLPMMRHTILVETGEGEAWEALRDAPDQHFLGDDLLIAPVLDEGVVERSVVLPVGRWYGLLDGTSHDVTGEPTSVAVAAPLGTIPVFARAGLVLPLGDPEVVTSYPETGDVVGAADRADRLHFVVFTGADGSLTLDGRAWTLASTGAAGGGVPTLDGAPLEAACADEDATDCVQSDEDGEAVYRVDWAGAQELVGDGWTLSVDDAGGLSGTVTVRY